MYLDLHISYYNKHLQVIYKGSITYFCCTHKYFLFWISITGIHGHMYLKEFAIFIKNIRMTVVTFIYKLLSLHLETDSWTPQHLCVKLLRQKVSQYTHKCIFSTGSCLLPIRCLPTDSGFEFYSQDISLYKITPWLLYFFSRPTFYIKIHCKISNLKTWVLWACAHTIQFVVLECCGSAEPLRSLRARVLWDWGGLTAAPAFSLKTWTEDVHSHHYVSKLSWCQRQQVQKKSLGLSLLAFDN